MLLSFRVPDTGHVDVRQLIDDGNLRPPRDDRVDVQVLMDHSTVFDAPLRDEFELTDLGDRFTARVRFDEFDHDIHATPE